MMSRTCRSVSVPPSRAVAACSSFASIIPSLFTSIHLNARRSFSRSRRCVRAFHVGLPGCVAAAADAATALPSGFHTCRGKCRCETTCLCAGTADSRFSIASLRAFSSARRGAAVAGRCFADVAALSCFSTDFELSWCGAKPSDGADAGRRSRAAGAVALSSGCTLPSLRSMTLKV